ncbi:hypothetical protein DV737_g1988, partial [Chaetothyriales sp. CBS 132003]
MLDKLPVECVQQIIGYLPSASAIANVAAVNRALYAKISCNDYGMLQYFVQSSFPSVKVVSGSWREAAIALTARSTTRETIVWQTSRFPHGDEPQNDILELRLLRPHQSVHADRDSTVFRRANGEVGLVATVPPGTDGGGYRRGEFVLGHDTSDCMDVSSERQPVLALCSTQTVRLYQVGGDRVGPIEAIERFTLEADQLKASRQRCARFLRSGSVAVAAQYLRGRNSAPIKVYDVNANLGTDKMLAATWALMPSDLPDSGKNWANTIAPLDQVRGNDGTLFLSGWSDGVVRLHDTRTGTGSVMSYVDKVDDGQVLSLQPIGHESFLAGSTQNGCLKTFDMRMPGAKQQLKSQVGRDINIFLALKLPQRQAGWKPLPANDPATDRYHGPVYSLSAPSASSPSVYAGIEDHVLQLTFSSTDDIKRGLVVDPLHGLDGVDEAGVLDLSCYERPREGFESTDAVLLRKQRALTAMSEDADLAMAAAEARALYRSILRELPPRTPIMLARRQEAEQFVQYLKAQRTYGALLERYNPGMGMDQEDRIRLTARRVGMDLPKEWKEGGEGKAR